MKLTEIQKLSTPELKAKKNRLLSYSFGLSTLGLVSGFFYANKTGGKFFRYVGFGIMGSIALCSIAYFTNSPKLLTIAEELNKRDKEGTTDT